MRGLFRHVVRALFGPGRFGRMRRSPWRRWSSSHPCRRAIREGVTHVVQPSFIKSRLLATKRNKAPSYVALSLIRSSRRCTRLMCALSSVSRTCAGVGRPPWRAAPRRTSTGGSVSHAGSARDRSARPRTARGARRCNPRSAQWVVELRWGEKRTGRGQNLIGDTQLLHLGAQPP